MINWLKEKIGKVGSVSYFAGRTESVEGCDMGSALSLSPEQTEVFNKQMDVIYRKLFAEAEETRKNKVMNKMFKFGVAVIALAITGVALSSVVLKKLKALLRVGVRESDSTEGKKRSSGNGIEQQEVTRPVDAFYIARGLELPLQIVEHIKRRFPYAIDERSGTVWLTEQLCQGLRAYGFLKEFLQEVVNKSDGGLKIANPQIDDIYDSRWMMGSSLTATCRIVSVDDPGLMKSDGEVLVKALVSVKQV